MTNDLSFDFSPTAVKACPAIARRAVVRQVLVKDEGERPLGNFKVLGGLSAGLKALARAAGVPVERLGDYGARTALPMLICASDGNHGLAVASGARLVGAPATIYLHTKVDAHRIARIEAQGARAVIVDGTYDDAVAAASAAARRGEGLLIPDTSDDPDDTVVRDVMRGYGVMTAELKVQLGAESMRPTHLFVQAGVGGLAAAMAQDVRSLMAAPRALVVVEPDRAACVAHALITGRVERIEGDLATAAEMLSCGLASAPAMRILRNAGALPVTVSERDLAAAVRILRDEGSIESTPSGAAGLAGLLHASADPQIRTRCHLTAESVVLLVSTETSPDRSQG